MLQDLFLLPRRHGVSFLPLHPLRQQLFLEFQRNFQELDALLHCDVFLGFLEFFVECFVLCVDTLVVVQWRGGFVGLPQVFSRESQAVLGICTHESIRGRFESALKVCHGVGHTLSCLDLGRACRGAVLFL